MSSLSKTWLSSRAGLRCQPLHAGCQKTEWGTGHYTLQGRGQHGAMPEKHAVQRMNFEETGSQQKSLHVLHSPSDQGHFTFHWNLLSAILSPTSWRKTPSFPPPEAPLHSANTSQPENYFQRTDKTAAGTPDGRRPWGRQPMQGLCCLGKCSPATPCQHSTPSALPKVSVRKPFFSFSFFFCSYQFKQEQWIPQTLQECDKVSTKPTRKVMYGPWVAAPINHFTNQRCKEWALQPEPRMPAPCTLKLVHPTPTLTQLHLSPSQQQTGLLKD